MSDEARDNSRDKLAIPWVDDVSDDHDGPATLIQWRYGPQGHPASYSMTIYEDSNTLTLWENGPLIVQRYLTHEANFFNVLERGHALGVAIDRRFGSEWRWHFCKPTCSQWSSDGPPYKPCQDCARVRELQQSQARAFWEEHRNLVELQHRGVSP